MVIAMAPEKEIEDFVGTLRLSGLLPPGGETTLLAELANEGVKPATARGLADELVKRQILTTWQADMLLQGKHRGFHLGPYVILRSLGHGAMGTVFLARHVMINRCRAIKILANRYREDPDLLNRFQVEAQTVAALDHPNIVRFYDFNKDTSSGNEVYYLVMEYVEGQDLQRMVTQDGVLEFQRAADFVRQAATGLAYAHEAGFVHCDIKPANLLVDGKGTLKILDLGLARFATEARKGSQSESAVSGTPDYIAPEQITDRAKLDGRADIYSLGLTFYFLLVGHRPFMKQSLPEILTAHCSDHPRPIDETRPDVPYELTAIFEKMTAKSPEQRYSAAGQVAADLQAWLDKFATGQSSRLSAIKAAAMRSRQRATADSPDPEPPSKADPDLELAPLDDQPTAPTTSIRSSGSSTHRSRKNGKDVPPREDTGKSGTTAAKPTPKSTAPVSIPAVRRDTVEPSGVAYLLAELPVEPEPNFAAPISLRPASRPEQPWWRIVRSPWLWVAVVGLLITAAIVVLAALSGLFTV
jgi:serine/threonine-protein kinase